MHSVAESDLAAHLSQACQQKTLHDVGLVAADAVRHFYSQGAAMVCAPITSGGSVRRKQYSIDTNLEYLQKKIRSLGERNQLGLPIFNHLLFVPAIRPHLELFKQYTRPIKVNEYYWPILEHLYRPILETGFINGGFFAAGWKGSNSSSFVHDWLVEHDQPIVYLH